MNPNKLIKAIVLYDDFILLSEETKQEMLNNEKIEFLISIKENRYEKLSEEEKLNIKDFERTEMEPLRKPAVRPETLFITAKPLLADNVTVLEQSFKEKHKKQSKPQCPKNIMIRGYNSKKKGGR
ncbi:MAG: hypothetical protein VZR95_00835 [Alphaproteobacteria bacterium]